MSYDVIVVGARVAGSATGMLLARKGLRVLVVDRASFPSDTLSSHQLQPSGAERLARWGLLDRLVEAGTPGVNRIRFDNDGVVLTGAFPDGGALYSPRRTVLDAMLVDEARAAGAEVRERTIVDQVLASDGRATGIRCHVKGSPPVVETAPLVVGADGKHSLVASTFRARSYRQREARSLAFYTYWQDVQLDGGELYGWDRRIVGAWPTNDGLVVTYIGWPVSEFETFRADPMGNVLATLDGAGDLGERARAGTHVGPLRGTVDLPNVIRRPYGPGWALAGDAGLVMDSITGQGIGHALRDAELLSDAVAAGLGGGRLDKALARYAKARDAQTKPMYDMTVRLASFMPPSAGDHLLFSAIAEHPEQTDQFFGVLGGSVPVRKFFAPGNLIRLVGARGFAKLARSQMRPARPRPAPALSVAA
jgi:flavin-dependent dehydrogenase